MATTAEQMRTYQGPALLSFGFRPFFLFGAAWAALAVALWLPMLAGHLALPTAFGPIEWHMHELIFGYVPAVVAGFLLTAVPNWTGRLPVTGAPLLALVLLWVAGRLAVLVSAWIGPLLAALVDLSFLAALAAVAAREIIAGKNSRNLRVLAAVALLFAGNAVFHIEAATGRGAGYGWRLGIAATLMLIMLVGGRIIPSFTRNWLARQGPGRLPQPFDRKDAAFMALGALALASWVAAPGIRLTAWLGIVAAAAHVWRLGRWAGERTLAEPLVTVLHVAYAFVPLGFALLALAILAPSTIVPSGAVHAWTTGAIGLMTLAVMTRASLGHTGRDLVASHPIQLIYGLALVAALARIGAAFGSVSTALLTVSATAWVAAFAGFVVVYAPLLLRPRPSRN